MATTAIGSTTSGGGAAGSANRFSELSSEEFIQVMITQLQQQDPFKPQDSSALLEQISSIRNIESQISLQDALKGLVFQNQIASAGNLIGKTVLGLDESNNQVEGKVTSVRVADDKVMLELDSGQTLELNRVTAITEADTAA
jgi:flagellar basal-body rod modification protein FlgD